MILTTGLNNAILNGGTSSVNPSDFAEQFILDYSIETLREAISYHPYHFYQQRNSLIPVNSECNTLVFQYAWQNTMKAGRSDIQQAIDSAKSKLRDYVGYRIGPEYVTREIKFPKPADARMQYGRNAGGDGLLLGVDTFDGYIKEVGVQAFTAIDLAAVAYSDANSDGLIDTATITITDIDESVLAGDVACYWPSAYRPDGSTAQLEKWRIHPDSIDVTGTTLTIKLKSWVLVRPILLDGIAQSAIDPADTANKFADLVEVYRRFTNADGTTTSNSQAVLIWEASPPGWACTSPSNPTISNDPAAVGYAVARCGIRNSRLGILTPGLSIYDETNLEWFGVDWSNNRQPDRVKIRYLAGANLTEQTEENIFSGDWSNIITNLAIAELAQHICACESANAYIDNMSEDLARISGNADKLFRVSEQDLNNPFGTRRGHIYAWKRVQKLALARSFLV